MLKNVLYAMFSSIFHRAIHVPVYDEDRTSENGIMVLLVKLFEVGSVRLFQGSFALV